MFLFMLFFIGLVLCFSCFHAKDKSVVLVSCSGIFIGIFVSILCAVFSFRHRIIDYSFSSNFIYFSLYEYVLPLILVYLLYFFTTSDDIEFKIRTFFPIVAGFFSVYMPYSTISSGDSVFSFFDLFIKPVLVLCEIVFSSVFVLAIARSALKKNIWHIILFSVFLALSIFIPPFLNTLWLFKIWLLLFYIIVVLYSALAFIMLAISSRSKDGILL